MNLPMKFRRFIRGASCKCRIIRNVSTQAKVENENTTHFGYTIINENEKTGKVYDVFEKVADSYDQMNDVMSFGIHRLWKHIFIQRLNAPPGTQLLDVAGGSGDIAFRFLNQVKKHPTLQAVHSCVTVCDINEHMLNVGKKRAEKYGFTIENEIDWLIGDAEKLPVPDNAFTAYTISFGIRNVTHIEKVLEEAYRILKPGGRFMCLEFSQVNNTILRSLYDSYSFNVIPVIGQLVAGQWKPYQYLVESIRKFPNQETFKSMIEDAGFRFVTYENLTFGTVAIHSGFKL